MCVSKLHVFIVHEVEWTFIQRQGVHAGMNLERTRGRAKPPLYVMKHTCA